MTEDERQMLARLSRDVESLRSEFRTFSDAFLEVPVGSPDGTKSLLEKLRIMASNWDGMSWALRALAWIIPAATAAAAGLVAWLKGFLE